MLITLLQGDNQIKKDFVEYLKMKFLFYLREYDEYSNNNDIDKYLDYIEFMEEFCKISNVYPDDKPVEEKKYTRLYPNKIFNSRLFKLIYVQHKKDIVIADAKKDVNTIINIQQRLIEIIEDRNLTNGEIDIYSESVPIFEVSNELIRHIIYNGKESRFLAQRVSVEKIVLQIHQMSTIGIEDFDDVGCFEVFKHYSKDDIIKIQDVVRKRVKIISDCPWVGNLVSQ